MQEELTIEEKMKLLVDILLDKNEEIGARDDAAMELANYDSDFTLDALIKVAQGQEEDFIILDSCGESIAHIWLKRNYFDYETYKKLAKSAQNSIYLALKKYRIDWLQHYQLK